MNEENEEALAPSKGFFYLGRMRAIAIIPAAGQGTRFGSALPKQYHALGGKPLFEHTLQRFEEAETISGVIIVAAPDRIDDLTDLLSKQFPKVLRIIPGGATRQASVANGFRAIAAGCDVVVVHDMARPLIPVSLINRCVEVAAQCGAAIVAAPVSDTVKRVREEGVEATLPREMIWLAQTPQAVRYELFQRAIEYAESSGVIGTDEAALVEALGERVAVVPGPKWNLKITTPEDFVIAEALCKAGLA